MPRDMLGEAIAPLHRRWVAEPELLLHGIGGVRARAADVGRMLRAALDAAPSLIVAVQVAGLEWNGPPDRWCCCSGVVHSLSSQRREVRRPWGAAVEEEVG